MRQRRLTNARVAIPLLTYATDDPELAGQVLAHRSERRPPKTVSDRQKPSTG